MSRRALLLGFTAVGAAAVAACTSAAAPVSSSPPAGPKHPLAPTLSTRPTLPGGTASQATAAPSPLTPSRTAGTLGAPRAGSAPGGATGRGWQSSLVRVIQDGHPEYPPADGLRIPDFGSVGYRLGEAPVPEADAVRTVRAVRPVRGDNTAHLQRAIDEVGRLPLGSNGFRGVVLLAPGRYQIAGSIMVRRSGVVIRGAGDGDDPATSTILDAVGNAPASRDVLVLGGGGGWDGEVAGTRTAVTSEVVPIGGTSLRTADPAALRPGDAVVLVHPCSARWLAAIDGGGTGDDPPWPVGGVPIVYLRHVADVAGKTVTLDAPLYATLDRSLSDSYLYRWDRAGLSERVGVENLRIDIAARGPTDERHAATGITLTNVRDAWVRGCTVTHFSRAGIKTLGATRTTISGCRALSPSGRDTGGRRYNFDAEARSQLVLFTDCHAEGGRHSFVVNGGATASGVVFHRTTATGSLASSEGHRRWSQGLLFDNHREIRPATERTILLGDRGDYGTAHGWAAVNSVAWNCDVGASRIVVQRPPTAQNYAIGCRGAVNGDGPFAAPTGHVEGTGRPDLVPASLYDAARAARWSR